MKKFNPNARYRMQLAEDLGDDEAPVFVYQYLDQATSTDVAEQYDEICKRRGVDLRTVRLELAAIAATGLCEVKNLESCEGAQPFPVGAPEEIKAAAADWVFNHAVDEEVHELINYGLMRMPRLSGEDRKNLASPSPSSGGKSSAEAESAADAATPTSPPSSSAPDA